jgi:hypothetical protein
LHDEIATLERISKAPPPSPIVAVEAREPYVLPLPPDWVGKGRGTDRASKARPPVRTIEEQIDALRQPDSQAKREA